MQKTPVHSDAPAVQADGNRENSVSSVPRMLATSTQPQACIAQERAPREASSNLGIKEVPKLGRASPTVSRVTKPVRSRSGFRRYSEAGRELGVSPEYVTLLLITQLY